jgi:hypothetical protein
MLAKTELQEWIRHNLYRKGGKPHLSGKSCTLKWFTKYGHLDVWNAIEHYTSFLNSHSPTVPQRLWHIIYDKPLITCGIDGCDDIPTFIGFIAGYNKFCCSMCAQSSPDVIAKIKATNLVKYGCEHGLSNPDVISKKNATVRAKYGVDNISQLAGISDKKKATCLRNYGTEWFLGRQDLKESVVNDRYGVKNVQQVKSISARTSATRHGEFYDSLFDTDRLKGKCIPMFTKQEYVSVGIESKHPFECTDCHTVFNGWLHDGDVPRCTKCYPPNASLFEAEITEYVRQLLGVGVEVIENTKSILSGSRELDIYVPSKKLAIECDGLFWHGENLSGKDKRYHMDKLIECESKGIRLLHIFEDEWSSQRPIVEAKIRHILGLNTSNVVYARKCKVVEDIPSSFKRNFMDNNHIQGNDNSIIYLGLSYNDVLVAMMTFSNKRAFIGYKDRSNKKEFELSRYASLLDHNVVGGASKLLSHFIKLHKPERIISYADRRWTRSSPNLYEQIGFTKINDGTPNYWYFRGGEDYNRHHRFGFRKDVLAKRLKSFNPEQTEWENMKNNGWDRIWDCGNLRYEMAF